MKHIASLFGDMILGAYRRIVNLVKQLHSNFPVLACTATATHKVQEDIKKQIDNSKLTLIRGSLSRKNFSLEVIKASSQEAKMAYVIKLLRTLPGTGIIYCGTQMESEQYGRWIEFNNINATYYNAGLDNESRVEIEKGLFDNKYKCVVSTNALGMGMDKKDIRFIIHIQIPTSPLHYYQEIGRAGRDDEPTSIYLFYNNEDDELPLSFIKGGRPTAKSYQKVLNVIKQEPLGLFNVVRKVNLKKTTVNLILNDLMDQNIILKNNKNYEYKYGAPELNTVTFEALKKAKGLDFKVMKKYVFSNECRMLFLSKYLGDTSVEKCGKCDNDNGIEQTVNASKSDLKAIDEFRESNFPILAVNNKTNIIIDGVAASYYGISNIGTAIHRSKYENGGDFPSFLLRLTLKAFRKHFGNKNFDLVLYVPPTLSGDLVKNFAIKIARTLGFPISDALVKIRSTEA